MEKENATVPIGTAANGDAAGALGANELTHDHGQSMAKLTTPPPAGLAQLPTTGGVLVPWTATGKEVYQTPPREVLRQITPIMSPATISKNELNDAALTLKFLSEGWNSVDGKGNTKRPRSDRRGSMGMDTHEFERVRAVDVNNSMTPTGEWADDGYDVYGYDGHAGGYEEQTPIQYSGKSKRAASRKCVALLKEALFEESQQIHDFQAQRPQSAARRSSLGASSSFSAGKLVPGTVLKNEVAGVSMTAGVGIFGTPGTASAVLKGSKGVKHAVPKVSMAKGRKKGVASGEGRKRSRNYSENSRVGRAVQNIYKYIIEHQTRYLGSGAKGVPERVIREEYGNNPDTSKALRYLVAENRINKEGAGGRRDPFSYTIKSVPSSATQTAEYDPNDKKTALLRSLGLPPPELCMEGSVPRATPDAVVRKETAHVKQTEMQTAMRKRSGMSDVRLVDPPCNTTHEQEHHPTFEEPSATNAMEHDVKTCLESKQSTKSQPRLSFGDTSASARDAGLKLPSLPNMPSIASLPALPLLTPLSGCDVKILDSTVIDPAKAAELQTSFDNANAETQAAMMMQVQQALLTQTIAMIHRVSRQSSGEDVASETALDSMC